MLKHYLSILALLSVILIGCQSNSKKQPDEQTQSKPTPPGNVEVYAELEINPGNVAVSKKGGVFMTVHPLRRQDLQLVEVFPDGSYSAFPDSSFQTPNGIEVTTGLDTPLGVIVDNKDRLWVVDAGLSTGKTRVFAFQVETGEELFRFEVPGDIAPKTSFAQDLAIDDVNEWVYLADFGDTGIIAIDIKNNTFRKFTDSTMLSEDIDMVIDGEIQNFQGAPARVGINPITISDDRETIYFGAMNGETWYSVAAAGFRNGESDEVIKSSLKTVGPKPISDGVATGDGKHYFTNLGNGSIDVLENGELKVLGKDPRIVWPDNVRIGPDGWLYVAVNQLHKSPAFTGGEDESVLPYYIMKVKM
ncbi:MAG: major royal jelly family protein [bacterium]|nr:major royal jelly family protein [bacterium]